MGVLLLVRHGQASFGADDYDVLSETGWEQGRLLGRWLAEHGPDPVSVVHGGMRRHRETWEAIADGAGWVPGLQARVDSDWAEFDHLAVIDHFAASGGVSLEPDADRRAFQEHFEVSTAHWSAAGAEAGYPESFDAFATRSRTALEAAAELSGPTLVVTSGGVIAALAALLVAPEATGSALGPIWARFNTVIANSSASRVILGSSGVRLLTFNEHPHLPRPLITYR